MSQKKDKNKVKILYLIHSTKLPLVVPKYNVSICFNFSSIVQGNLIIEGIIIFNFHHEFITLYSIVSPSYYYVVLFFFL